MKRALSLLFILLSCLVVRAEEPLRLAVDLFLTPKKDKPGVALESSIKGASWVSTMPLISKGNVEWQVHLDFGGKAPVPGKTEVEVTVVDLAFGQPTGSTIFNAAFVFQDGKKITILDTGDYKLQATFTLEVPKDAAKGDSVAPVKKE